MNSLKSFVKNIAEKAQTDFSPQRVPGQVDGAGIDQESAEGFICPACMRGFSLPEELERHYTHEHVNTGPTSDVVAANSFADLKDEVQELQTTLKEEQYYSAELKKEVERLSNAVQRGSRDQSETASLASTQNGGRRRSSAQTLDQEEKLLFETQVAALEQAKLMLTNEVTSLKKSLDETALKVLEYERIAEKVGQMSAENVGLKAALDEMSGHHAAAEEKLKILETVLAQRNNCDDVAVLRRELHNVQKLMMTDMPLQDQNFQSDLIDENEKLRQELRQLKENASQIISSDVDELKEKLEKAESKNFNLDYSLLATESKLAETEQKLLKVQSECESNFESSENLQSKLRTSEAELIETTSKLTSLQFEAEKSQSRVTHLEEKVSDVSKELSAYVQKLEEQTQINDDLKTQNLNQEAALNEASRQKSLKESEITDLQKECYGLKQEIERLDSERETLLTKIEAGDGVNTAMQQLKQQNELLSEQIDKLTVEKQSLISGYESKLEMLHVELQEAKTGLSNANEKMKKINQAKDELATKLETVKKENEKLQETLQTKSESFLAIESAHTRERQELENRLKGVHNSLEEKSKEIEKLQQLNGQVQQSLKMEVDKSSNLVQAQNAALESAKMLKEKVDELHASLNKKDSELKNLTATLDSSEKKKSEFETLVSSLQTEKENLEKKVSGLHIEKENLEKQVSTLIDAENRSESLNQDLQQTKVEVQNLEKLKHSLENLVTEKDLSLKAVRSELSQSQTSSDELLQQVAACKSRIEELNKAISEESVKLKSSENTVQNLKLEFDKTEARLHEVEKSNKDFLTTIEENIKTISLLEDDKNDLSIQLDSKNSMMDALNAELSKIEISFVEMSSELQLSKAESSEKEEDICRLQKLWETDKLKQEEKILDLERAKELLLNSKVDLQNEVDKSSVSLEALKKELEAADTRTKDLSKKLNATIEECKHQMVLEKKEHEKAVESERQKWENISHQILEAQQKVKEAEARVMQAEARLLEMSLNYDSALSSRLELEAKVESASDERRSLLERCLGAESELERSRAVLVELRRKLDDSQAALHELGRENQSIQVELARQSNRKWADDSEVNTCLGCRSPFTLTNRKHHCRNCGKIFCADCSNKQANMPDYKKPQRVCDTCHSELQLGK